MKNISVFKNFVKEIGSRSLSEIVSGIRGTHYKEAVFQIRKAVERGDKEEADKLKKGLLGFTVSGEFAGGRRMEFLKSYNPFVILDIDKLEVDVVKSLLDKINGIAFTRVSFISPSGRGVKIIVSVNSEREEHWLAYKQVAEFYEKELGVMVDQSGKDITRLCFMSHDPSAYFNPESEVFEVLELKDHQYSISEQGELNFDPGNMEYLEEDQVDLNIDFQGAFAKCVAQIKGQMEFKKGNRNNFIYQLAACCRYAGIPLEITNKYSKASFDLSNDEIDKTVKSAYSWKPKSKPEMMYFKPERFIELEEETPSSIPVEIFPVLPKLLREGCMAFKEERERDVFLTGALGVLSGCLPNVSGDYDGFQVYPNLYIFVIAPSASGKGALKFAKILGMSYHNQLVEESKKEQKEYKRALFKFELDSILFKKGKRSEAPIEPKEAQFKTLFIPANSSSAMLIRHLQDNEEMGVLFESEADTLGNVLKHDWGGFSDLMRKAYHHEPISSSRKSNSEYVEIKVPKLSIALSGTPGQVTGLIPSSEDGLFSRFLFYAFEGSSTWRDVSPAGRPLNFQSKFEEMSEDVIEMVRFLKKNPMRFNLTATQWKMLNLFYKELVDEMISKVSKDTLSVIRRSGLMLFRIAMILSALRKYEKQDVSESVICRDVDFESALSMVKVYFRHSFFLFDRLPKRVNNSFQFKNVKKQLFFDALPDRFPRKEAIRICGKLKMVTRTADRYLKELVKSGYLSKSTDGKFGEYFKTGKT